MSIGFEGGDVDVVGEMLTAVDAGLEVVIDVAHHDVGGDGDGGA